MISGTGDIPAGSGLWIVVVPDIDAKPHEHWLGAQATMDSPQHWSIIEPVSIGRPAPKSPDRSRSLGTRS